MYHNTILWQESKMGERMKDQLLNLGWIDKGDVLVRYSDPRIGWKQDGTLIIGYHEYKDKVHTIEELNKALCGIRV